MYYGLTADSSTDKKGWVYVFHSLEGDILYGVKEWLKRRAGREKKEDK